MTEYEGGLPNMTEYDKGCTGTEVKLDRIDVCGDAGLEGGRVERRRDGIRD